MSTNVIVPLIMIRFLHLDTARIDGIAGVIGCKVDVGDVPDSSQPMIPSQTSWMIICTHPNPSAADVHWNQFHYSDVTLLPGNKGLITGYSEQCVRCHLTGYYDRQIQTKPLFTNRYEQSAVTCIDTLVSLERIYSNHLRTYSRTSTELWILSNYSKIVDNCCL